MFNMIDTPQPGHSQEAGFGLDLTRWAAPSRQAYGGPERRSPASQQLRQMAQLMDAIDYGMVLMYGASIERVAMVNKAARAALDDRHPLVLVEGQISTRQAGDLHQLREAMLGAQRRGLRRLVQLGQGDDRISVAVVPLLPLGTQPGWGVALLTGRRQVCEALSVDWFARTHGLTLAESAVIRGLCADLTPQEIAQRQGVGLATVRTQIGSIRHKTGACSIRALVQQVALLPPLTSALQATPPAAGVTSAAAAGAARRAGARHLND